ncbi:hypothetical protein GGS24DRAFT_452170 [Hypoxylon argillaceum]|nr:hypothetical protein GGS24DRAFT_452170 [Hypoxylon argillaceum]
MISTPRDRAGPKRSKYLPKAIEDELRILVLDCVDDFGALGGKAPQIIIGNPESGCHGTYFQRRDGTEFIFHHCKMKFAMQCKCTVQAANGATTYQIPDDLDRYRVRLIRGENVPFRLEPNLAAMVTMKIVLGMSLPEVLKMKTDDEAAGPAMDVDEQGEIAGPSGHRQEEGNKKEGKQGGGGGGGARGEEK